jgi:hypothetical protein
MRERLEMAYESVADVASGLAMVEEHCLPRRDRRGIFATAYLLITGSIAAALDAGRFEDEVWTRRYLVGFGNLYRGALFAWESGRVAGIPTAWRLSFEAARNGTGLVIQHLVLGINAHINHDLALALAEAGLDPDREMRYRDHVRVNEVLEEATPALKEVVSTKYAPLLQRVDWISGRLDDDLARFSIPTAREHAWKFASAYVAARGATERALLVRGLDEQSAALARLTLSRPTRHPILLRTVRTLEWVDDAWRRLRGA